MSEDDYFQLYYSLREDTSKLEIDLFNTAVASSKLVKHLCDGCQHTFACDSIDVCKLTNNLKKVLEDYLD